MNQSIKHRHNWVVSSEKVIWIWVHRRSGNKGRKERKRKGKHRIKKEVKEEERKENDWKAKKLWEFDAKWAGTEFFECYCAHIIFSTWRRAWKALSKLFFEAKTIGTVVLFGSFHYVWFMGDYRTTRTKHRKLR